MPTKYDNYLRGYRPGRRLDPRLKPWACGADPGQAAEFAGQYLRKGRLVLVEGRLHARNWQAHDGTARRIVEVVADTLQAVSPKPADEATEGAIETAVATAG
jgi:hypothetical protein